MYALRLSGRRIAVRILANSMGGSRGLVDSIGEEKKGSHWIDWKGG
jgi:hypothetical protein